MGAVSDQSTEVFFRNRKTGVAMNDRDTIEVFIKNRIRSSGSWLHVTNERLKIWIRDECERRRYNPVIVEEILDKLLP